MTTPEPPATPVFAPHSPATGAQVPAEPGNGTGAQVPAEPGNGTGARADRLTDALVAIIARGTSNRDTRALAREVQEYRSRRCDGCAEWRRFSPLLGDCDSDAYTTINAEPPCTAPDHACNAWQPKAGQ